MAHRLCCHFFSWATFSHTSCCQRRIPSQLCRAFQGSRFHRHFSPKKSKWSQTASNPASILVDKIFNGRTNQLASSLWLSRRNRDAFSSPILFWWPTVQFLYKYCSERWFFQRLFRTLIQQGDRTQLSCPGDCSPPCPLLLTMHSQSQSDPMKECLTVNLWKLFWYHQLQNVSQRHVSERTKVEIKHDLQNLDLLRTKYKYIWDSEIWAVQHKVVDELDQGPTMETLI